MHHVPPNWISTDFLLLLNALMDEGKAQQWGMLFYREEVRGSSSIILQYVIV